MAITQAGNLILMTEDGDEVTDRLIVTAIRINGGASAAPTVLKEGAGDEAPFYSGSVPVAGDTLTFARPQSFPRGIEFDDGETEGASVTIFLA